MSNNNIVVAIASATVFLGAQRVHIQQGTAWAADSPAVAAHPDMFSDDPQRALGLDLEPVKSRREGTAPVEKKTANPGEKSTAKRIFNRGR